MTQAIKLLGSLHITDENGRFSPLMKSGKGCALLTYLVVQNEPQPREKLGDLLWQTTTTSRSLHNLRTLLTRTRPFLPELQTTRSHIHFQPDPARPVDLIDLQAALQSDDLAVRDNGLQLYQGDLLADFHLTDALYFNEWLIMARERLRQQVLLAYQQLCRDYAEQKGWSAIDQAARRWLTLDELDERAHRWLITALLAQGDRAGAKQQYEQCRQLLWEELGVEPEQETAVLLTQSRSESPDTAPAWPPAAELATPGPLPPAAYLPYLRNRDFVGRTDELLQLASLLQAERTTPPVVALTGIGGLGKTQTAVEFCYRYGRFFPGGLFWLNFADPDNVAEEVARIGSERGMGLYQEADRLTLADRVGRVQRIWQEPTPRLLIFDNCEAEDLLQTWLPVSGGCRLLLTSRRGEWARELGVVAVPLQTLHPTESITLLRQIAPHIPTTAAEQVANEVGHLPLALHLAGGFLKRYRQISPAAYVSQLRDKNLIQHPSLQGHGLSHSPTHHELHIARTYAVSYAQLDAQDPVDELAQRLLSHAICFAPGEPLARELLLATVLPPEPDIATLLHAEDGLARLIALGFVRLEGEEQLVMHRLVTAFTRSQVGDLTAAIAAVEQVVAQRLTAVWKTSLHMAQLPVAIGQSRYITDRALTRHDLTAATLAVHLGQHFLDVEASIQAEPYLAQAVAIRQELLGDSAETAVALVHMGTFFFRQQHFAIAQQHYEQAATMYEQAVGAEHPRTALNLNNLANVHSRQGRYEKAVTYYQQAITKYSQTKPAADDPTLTMFFINLGITYRRMGLYSQAREAYHQALAWRETHLGTESLTTMSVLHNLGYLELQVGHYDLAEAYFNRVLAVREQALGKKSSATAMAQINLAKIATIKQDVARAKTMLAAILVVFTEQLGAEHSRVGEALSLLGDVCRQLGQHHQAHEHLLAAKQIHEGVGEQREETVETLLLLADYYLEVRELVQAKAILDQVTAICAVLVRETHPFMGRLYLRWGEWYEQQGEVAQAAAFFEKAQEILSPAGGETAVSPSHIDFVRLQKQIGTI